MSSLEKRPYCAVPYKYTVAALGLSGGVPVTVESSFPAPSTTVKESCPVGTATQVDESAYFTPVVTDLPLTAIPIPLVSYVGDKLNSRTAAEPDGPGV